MHLWFDYELITGDRFERVVRDKINSCGAFILVMTPTSEESDWVSREVTQLATRIGRSCHYCLLATRISA